ncbi:class I SAM-dependent methyltransferase [Bacillus tianshenii]|nr:class I SAM-dependent methyltransferase [Bacillus tianshenii]
MGREFIGLFDEWAKSYDEAVVGHDLEYKDVFINYDKILEETAEATFGHVIEFGLGTGNLTEKLITKGRSVYGVEPSAEMRTIATKKLNDVTIVDGDFLNFPAPKEPVDSITSTYAFHHLTDEEKDRAIQTYSHMLPTGGVIAFADTIFQDEEAKQAMISKSEQQGFLNLAQDLRTEYYTTIEFFEQTFEKHDFSVSFKRINDFVFLMTAVKR